MSINDPKEVEAMQKDQKDEAQEELRYHTATFPLGDYEHYKGGKYCVFALSINEDTLEVLVHYFSYTKGTRWTRTLENFKESIELPGLGTMSRFKFLSAAMNSDILFATGML
jgi:hypothetical protein